MPVTRSCIPTSTECRRSRGLLIQLAAQMSDIRARWPRAASPQPFRVSDAGRRRKVVDARTRGPRSVCYGDFEFVRRCKLIDAAHMQTVLRADRPLFGWRCGCSNADGRILAGMSPLLRKDDAGSSVPRSEVAAGAVSNEPCRVTTLVSRLC